MTIDLSLFFFFDSIYFFISSKKTDRFNVGMIKIYAIVN